MSLRDPHYEHNASDANPFLALPIMKKLISSGSCNLTADHSCLLECPCNAGATEAGAAGGAGTRTSSRHVQSLLELANAVEDA